MLISMKSINDFTQFNILIYILLFIVLLNGCVTHDTIPNIIKVPKFYPYKFERDKLITIADPYNERGKARYIFGKDIRKKGIYPVHIIFQNEGGNHFDIALVDAVLIDERGQEYSPIDFEEASRTILKNTPLRVISYGLLGSVFLVLTVPFAVSAGVSSYRTNKAIQKDFGEKQFAKELIRPYEVSHGFVFFSLNQDGKKVSLDAFDEVYSLKLRTIENITSGGTFDVTIRINVI